MAAYHITEICNLQSEIQQFHADLLTWEDKRGLIRRFIDWAANGQAECMVLEDTDGQVLAYYILLLSPETISFFYTEVENMPKVAYLAQIVVASKIRYNGLGCELMDAIQKTCLDFGKNKLVLEVNSRAPALYWYVKQGFAEIGSQVFLEKKLFAD